MATDYNSKYSGEQVEALLDQVASGNAGGGGGGGIAVETDPVFLASPAASITEANKQTWSSKQDAISDLATIRSGAAKGATAVQAETLADYATEGYVDEEVKALGDSLAKVATSGSYNDLVDRPTFKTINNESIVGSGNITISGGSGEQGPQGDKGDKGDTGVGVQSVTQTTTSNADGGSNVVTVTLTDGTKSTFTVKNGSKGSQGIQGEQGPKGDTGATGATGAQGPKGDKGDTGPAGANGTNGTNGKDGVSVSSVKQTTTSTADGGTNVVTVTLSNGTTSTFSVKNGSKGSNGTNGTNGTNGKDGADGATFTPSVDSAGNLSWTNNKGLTNPPTVNIKGPKGDSGEGGGGSGGPTIVEIDAIDYNVVNLTDNTIYLYYGQLSNLKVGLSMPLIKGCLLRFETDTDCTLIIPDCYWANGVIPSIEGNTCYELSLTDNQDGYIFAVLTPFKSV